MNRNKKIFQRFAEGASYAEISKEFGISSQRVQQIVRPSAEVIKILRARSKDKCERCGIAIKGQGAHVHHTERISEFNAVEKLLFLCRSCHSLEDYKIRLEKNAKAPLTFFELDKAQKKIDDDVSKREDLDALQKEQLVSKLTLEYAFKRLAREI